MNSNKRKRKDYRKDLDNTKKIYKMYKAKKNWVIAPVVFGMLLPSLIAGPGVVVAEVIEAAKTEGTEMPAADIVENEVVPAVVEQKAGDVELEKAKAEGLEIIKTKTIHLSADERAYYTTAINKAETVEDVKSFVLQAYKLEITQANPSFISDELTLKVDAFTALSETRRNDIKNTILNTIFSTLNDYAVYAANDIEELIIAQTEFNKQLDKNIVSANAIIVAAQKENTVVGNLPAYKAEKIVAVKALIYLTELEKITFENGINAATTVADIDSQLMQAVALNKTRFTETYNAKVTELSNKLNETSLPSATKTALFNELSLLTAETAEVLTKLTAFNLKIDAAVKDHEANEAANKLAVAKSNLITVMTNDQKAQPKLISTTELAAYTNKAKIAKTIGEVQAIANEWTQFVEAKNIGEMSLANAKVTAEASITAMTNMDAVLNANFLANNAAAKTVEAVVANLEAAQKADNAAKVANELALKTAKENAIKAINALTSLTKAQKDGYVAQVGTASTVNATNTILKAAQTANAASELAKVKTDAKVKIDALAYLTDKPARKAAVDAASDAKSIAELVNVAIYDNYVAGAATAELATAKKLGTEAINSLVNLTAKEKAAALKDVTAAKTNADVTKAINAAQALDTANKGAAEAAKEFAKYQADANLTIDGLTELSPTVKAGFKAEVAKAKTKVDVDKVVTAAQAENTKIADAKTMLNNAKASLANTVISSSNLSATQKESLVVEISKAANLDEVKEITIKVKRLELENKLANANVATTKTELKAALGDTDLFDSLSSAQVAAYQDKIEAAKTKADMLTIFEGAKTENDRIHDKAITNEVDLLLKAGSYVKAQEKINTIRTASIKKEYQAQLDNNIALSNAKAKANTTIDSLSNLSVKEKAVAKEKVAKMTTVKEIETYVDSLVKEANADLIALAELQIKAKQYEEAAKTIAKITSSTEKARLEKLLKDAQTDKTNLSFQAHVAQKGWLPVGSVKAGEENPTIIGTTGQALSMEALTMSVKDSTVKGGITYRAHVRNIGWQAWKPDGTMAGTTGKALTIEALEIKLTDELAKTYNVEYRAHVRNLGWQGWVSNGAQTGTTGKATPVESIQVRLVKK